MSLIEISNLHKSYYIGKLETKVLTGTDFSAKAGEMVMVMGPSGSGKSTLLNIIGGIDTPQKGSVKVVEQDLTKLGPKGLNKYRRNQVGFIFQFYNLIPTLTAIENVELGIETMISDRREIRARAEKYMDLVGLTDKMNNYPQELSAGQQQRVAIARALAKEPKIILADEPTGNLDEDTSLKIMNLMKDIKKEIKTTFIIVSHDSSMKDFMDRTLVLHNGKLVPPNA